MSGESIWATMRDLAPGAASAARWAVPATIPSFTFLERIRQALPDDDESPEATAALTAWHFQNRGSGLGGAWRGPDDALLSPSWLALHSIAVDPSTGNVVAAARLNYQAWGIELDAPSFLQNDGIYVGSLRSGVMLPFELDISASSVDLNPSTGEVAVLHHLANSTFAVSLISETGERRLLTILEGIGGYEQLRYSPDGQWLIVPRSDGTYLIDGQSGRWLKLAIGNVEWYPSTGSSLLVITHDAGLATPRVFSLSVNDYVGSFPSIELEVPLLESFPYVWSPAASKDSDVVLARTPAGVGVEYQQQYGVGSRLARFDLSSGRGSLVTSVFANLDRTLERDVFDHQWHQARATSWSLTLHPDLNAQLNEPETTPADVSWVSHGRWADEAEIVLVSLLNRSIELVRQSASVSHLMPEIVAALRAIADTPVWDRQSDWLTNLRDITMSMVASGEMDGAVSTPWLYFAIAIRAIEQGQAEQITALTLGR